MVWRFQIYIQLLQIRNIIISTTNDKKFECFKYARMKWNFFRNDEIRYLMLKEKNSKQIKHKEFHFKA